MQDILLRNLAAIASVLIILWALSVRRRDVNVVDVFWGLGFVLIGWLSMFASGTPTPRTALLIGTISLWGFRLAAFLAWRNWGKPEDHRYAAMRRRHGKRFPMVSLLTVFGLQGILMWVIALPLQVGIIKGQPLHWGVAFGFLLWSVGMYFEVLGDYQLARFKSEPANQGRLMSQGLWRYTRHPNYFGECLIWWGFYGMAVDSASWWWTMISPLLMSFLLIRVSGVRLLEGSLQNRVAGYEEYINSTSSFIPCPPKRQPARD